MNHYCSGFDIAGHIVENVLEFLYRFRENSPVFISLLLEQYESYFRIFAWNEAISNRSNKVS